MHEADKSYNFIHVWMRRRRLYGQVQEDRIAVDRAVALYWQNRPYPKDAVRCV